MTQEELNIPPLWLEKAALAELSAQEELALAKSYGPAWEHAVLKLRAENQAWQSRPELKTEVAQIHARMSSSRGEHRRRRIRWAPICGLVVASAAVLIWLPREDIRQLQPEHIETPVEYRAQTELGAQSENRTKGLRAHLVLHRKVGSDAEKLDPNTHVKAGDLIQVSYVASDAKYGVIVSLDGAGQSTLHFPSSPRGSTQLSSDGMVPLNQAYELDGAPGFERFIFVSTDAASSAELSVATVLEAVRALASSNDSGAADHQRLALPDDWNQSSFVLRK